MGFNCLKYFKVISIHKGFTIIIETRSYIIYEYVNKAPKLMPLKLQTTF